MAESSTLQRPVLKAGNRLEDSGRSAQARGSFRSTMAVSSGLCSEWIFPCYAITAKTRSGVP